MIQTIQRVAYAYPMGTITPESRPDPILDDPSWDGPRGQAALTYCNEEMMMDIRPLALTFRQPATGTTRFFLEF